MHTIVSFSFESHVKVGINNSQRILQTNYTNVSYRFDTVLIFIQFNMLLACWVI
jgi:hypothetical protein